VFFQLLTEETMNDEAKKKRKKREQSKNPRSYLPLAHNSPNGGVPSVLAFHPSSPVQFLVNGLVLGVGIYFFAYTCSVPSKMH
jgi:hypothetical protein